MALEEWERKYRIATTNKEKAWSGEKESLESGVRRRNLLLRTPGREHRRDSRTEPL